VLRGRARGTYGWKFGLCPFKNCLLIIIKGKKMRALFPQLGEYILKLQKRIWQLPTAEYGIDLLLWQREKKPFLEEQIHSFENIEGSLISPCPKELLEVSKWIKRTK